MGSNGGRQGRNMGTHYSVDNGHMSQPNIRDSSKEKRHNSLERYLNNGSMHGDNETRERSKGRNGPGSS